MKTQALQCEGLLKLEGTPLQRNERTTPLKGDFMKLKKLAIASAIGFEF